QPFGPLRILCGDSAYYIAVKIFEPSVAFVVLRMRDGKRLLEERPGIVFVVLPDQTRQTRESVTLDLNAIECDEFFCCLARNERIECAIFLNSVGGSRSFVCRWRLAKDRVRTE